MPADPVFTHSRRSCFATTATRGTTFAASTRLLRLCRKGTGSATPASSTQGVTTALKRGTSILLAASSSALHPSAKSGSLPDHRLRAPLPSARTSLPTSGVESLTLRIIWNANSGVSLNHPTRLSRSSMVRTCTPQRAAGEHTAAARLPGHRQAD